MAARRPTRIGEPPLNESALPSFTAWGRPPARPAVATFATATLTATSFLRRRSRRGTRSLVLLAQQHLARQLDTVLIVDGDDLHLQAIADLADAIDALDVFVVQLADVTESLAAWQDLDESAEIL